MSRIFGICCAVVLATLAVALFLSSAAQAQTLQLYRSSAYGIYAYVGNTVTVAQTAPVSIGGDCGNAQVGLRLNGTVAGVSVVPLVTTGLVNTSVASTKNTSTASSDVHGINLLGGLIAGDEIKTVSTTTVGAHESLSYSSAGTTLVNLRVLGIPIDYVPAPNTTITLPLIGRIVLNEQIVTTRPGYAQFTINMIHVYVTLTNLLGILPGTEIVVADSSSGIELMPGVAAVDGNSYGSQITGPLLQSDKTAPVLIVCRGTNGVTMTNSQVGVNVANVVSSGTIVDTGVANMTQQLAYSRTTDQIQRVSVAGGLIGASVVKAQANGNRTDGKILTFTSSGSFVGLSVAGHPEITDNVPPNTTVSLAGLGTLYLHRIIQKDTSIEVRMIELVVNQTNVLGIPLGADVIVGVAEASLHTGLHP